MYKILFNLKVPETIQTVKGQKSSTVYLYCDVKVGTWRRVNGLMPENSQIDGSSLIFSSLSLEDAGEYECFNEIGIIVTRKKLEVDPDVLNVSLDKNELLNAGKVKCTGESSGFEFDLYWTDLDGKVRDC
jgi:hypothetical protein